MNQVQRLRVLEPVQLADDAVVPLGLGGLEHGQSTSPMP
jgi:hypothetical protein